MVDTYIPLAPVPSQEITVVLSAQRCRLKIFQKSTGLFADIYVSDALVVGGVSCLLGVSLVKGTYLGFIGTLAFIDIAGSDDPYYTGLGSRYFLVYQP